MSTERPADLAAFAEPSRDYGILPFWFLNGELDPDEMRFQLRELRDKGMHGVVFHGRYGLEMPYLGERYLDRIRLGVEEANRLGLKAWIYDEMNWPSGTADKRVLRARPDLAQRYLECVSFQITGPWFMCLTGEDSRYLDFERSVPVAAFAIGESGEVRDLTPNLSFHRVVPWEVPPGTWRLCYIVEKRADYYIDALDPESTAEFLRLGYAPYLEALGDGSRDAEGRSLVGFYSDEPAMHYFLTAGDNPIVPWTKDMFRRFMERNGYDLRSRLVDLFFDVHHDAARTRFHFYSTTTEFYSDAYYRQIHEWCRAHGVKFTAHLLYEEWIRQMIRVEGNLFKHYANMDVVAVDHLYPVIGTREAPDQHVAMKVASSAAHHYRSERLICESFGGIFMDATMQRMKWIADWEYVLGVNLLNPHGFHYTFEGARKRDWPPSMFYQYPWWASYRQFSRYISRTSEMLSGGRHVAQLAVLWPINGAFATYLPQTRTQENDLIASGLNILTDLLLRLHHDFDYLDEDVLAGADVDGGRVRIADEEYELVVLPPTTHLKASSVAALERFVAGGGKVLSVIRAPSVALGDQGLEDVAERVQAVLGRSVRADAEVLREPPGPGRDRLAMDLDAAVRALVEPQVELSNSDVFVLHREKDGRDVFFLANTTYRAQSARVVLADADGAVGWDPSTGTQRPLVTTEVADGRTAFEVALPPVASLFVVVPGSALTVTSTNLEITEAGPHRVVGYGMSGPGWVDVRVAGGIRHLEQRGGELPAPMTLDGPWTFTLLDDNALVVRSWLAAPEPEHGEHGSADVDLDTAGWQRVVAGAWALQLPQEPQRPWPVPVWYRVDFAVDDVPDRLTLLVDGFAGEDPRVFLNGTALEWNPVRSRVDAQMKELAVDEAVRRGRNVLAIRLVVTEPTGGLLDHVKLLGPFSVAGRAERERIVAPVTVVEPGSWTEQGYPFFSGRGVYAREVDVPVAPDGVRWLLEVPMRDDVVEVAVDGRDAGTCLWDPYVVDVSSVMAPGRHRLDLRVANTPANLLGGVARPSGLAGPPRLVPRRSFSWDLTAAPRSAVRASSEGGSA